MAKRSAQETAAAKAKKQKMILAVGGVLLVGLAALQGPKLMKHGASTASPPPVAAPSATGTPAPAAVAAAPVKGSAVVAGVALPRATVVKVETSQLASFTLFEAKDPFVQQVSSEAGDGADCCIPGRSEPRQDGDEHAAVRHDRLGARRDRHHAGRAAGSGHLRHDRLQHETAAGRGQGDVPDARAAVRPPLADEEAGEDQRRRRLVRRWQARDLEAREAGDARQHGDRRPLRAEARLHRYPARGDRGIHDRCEQELSDHNDCQVINGAHTGDR